MYDIIIIGAGPAGFTAGIYAARREMKTLIIGKEPGGQMQWASEIENYPGFTSIPSYELIHNMQEHVKANNVEIKMGEVSEIQKNEDGTFTLVLLSGDKIETKTVLIAIGLVPRKLDVPGEKEFLGKGVTYCANCDGPFYRDKIVAVAGGGNAALDAAEVLSKIASKVYLVHRRQEFKAFEVLVDEVKSKENIELVLDSGIKEVRGEDKVKTILVENFVSGEEREIDLDGVFIEIGRIAKTDIFANLLDRDEKSQILVDEYCRTNVEGIFAAGDVTQVPFKQISIATGQATVAVLAAYQYLQTKGK